MSDGDAPPLAPAPPPGASARRLRRAPEQREMALILGLAFFLNLFPGSLLQWLHFRWGLLLTQTLFIAGPAVLAIRWFYLDGRVVLRLRRPSLAALGGTALATAGLNHLLNLAGAWQDRVFPMPEALRVLWEGLLAYHGPRDFALLILLFGVVPAICEEILFRGFLQAGFVQVLESPAKGIALTALVFAGFHLDPWRFPTLLVLSLFLGYLAHATGSLAPPILAHALNNVMSISLADASGQGSGALGASAQGILGALALCAAGLLLVRRPAA